jgi:hypothetical protein
MLHKLVSKRSGPAAYRTVIVRMRSTSASQEQTRRFAPMVVKVFGFSAPIRNLRYNLLLCS